MLSIQQKLSMFAMALMVDMMALSVVQETIDGDLAVRVFGLLQLVDSGFHQSRYAERSRQRLDLAILSFFQSFRKVYVGEQVMHSSKVSCLQRLVYSDVGAPCQLCLAAFESAMS